MLNKIFIFFFIVWIAFWGKTTHWSPVLGEDKAESIVYMSGGNGVPYQAPADSYALASKCFGFTGVCDFEKLNLKLSLVFKGVQIKKPFFNLSLVGGNDGFQMRTYYFGKRLLTITDSKGVIIKEFSQIIWNTSAYSDFSQILFFKPKDKKLYISGRDGFQAVNELAYLVDYSYLN